MQNLIVDKNDFSRVLAWMCGIGAVASIAVASAATAADMPVRRAPVLKAPPPATYGSVDWSGFYLGGHAGFGAGQFRGTYFDYGDDGGLDFPVSGALAGGQFGYLMQFGRAVYGVEIDASWANLKGDTTNDDNVRQEFKTDFLGSARFRSGIAIDNVLLYSTFGLAYTKSSFGVSDGGGSNAKRSLNDWGVVGGLGAEWAFAPNWSARVEYLYYRFDVFDDDGENISGFAQNTDSPNDFVKLDGIHVGRVALNYRFNGSGNANTMRAPVMDWSGLYIGAHGGYLRSRINGFYDDSADSGSFKPVLQGFAGGGQIGYNVQSGAWVYGVEADASWIGGTEEARTDSRGNKQALTTRAFASARGRIGIAADDKLFYLTGGVGYVSSRLDTADAFESYRMNFDTWGPVIGGGVDWRFAPSWSARFESLTFLGSERTSTRDLPPTSGDPSNFVRQSTVTVARVGLNYHFQPAGIVAKY
jgi:outer membrane immunogenic protein